MNERVLLLTKVCKCNTGCVTGRCGCRKKGQSCAEGCSCLHCSNLPYTSGKEKHVAQDVAELETEEPHTSDGESEMEHFIQSLLAPTRDSESETNNESNSENEMLSD